MKRLLLMIALLMPVAMVLAAPPPAQAQCTTQCFVDPLYTGGGNNGTSTNPFTSIAAAMTQVNTNLATQNVTLFISASDPTNTTEQAIDGFASSQRTDGSTHILTIDGMSKYQTNATHSGAATWATNFVPPAPPAYPGQNYAKTLLTGKLKAKMTGSVPLDSTNSFSNCKGYFVYHGLDVANNNGQTANLTYIHDITLEYSELHRIAVGSGGPTVYIGPGQHGPCHTGAARPGGTDSGPDNVTVQYNYIHEGWGESIYDGASTSEPFVNGAPGSSQQVEGGTAGDNLQCGNGCAGNASCTTASAANASTCSTGANHVIKGNTIESGAAWGGQGDGLDIKDGHTNLSITGNTLNTTKYPACAPTCTNLVCYGGTGNSSNGGPGTTCTTNTQCTGGGICGAGNDGRGMIIESCSLVDGNFVQAPGHDAIDDGISWNTSTGRASCQTSNNVIVDVNSGIGHQYGLELESLNVTGLSPFGNMSYFNNSMFNIGNDVSNTGACFSMNSGGASGTVLEENNICQLSTSSGSFSIGTHDYNNYFQATGLPAGEGAHSITTNPKYRNTGTPYADTNFILQTNSPAVGAGLNLSGTFTNDYGNSVRTVPWTIGAWQPSTCIWSAAVPCVPDMPVTGATPFPDTGSFLANFFVNPTFNRVGNETNSGARIVFITDGTHPCDGTHNNSSWVTSSNNTMLEWSPLSAGDISTKTYYVILSSAPDGATFLTPCLITFNYTTFQATQTAFPGTVHMTPNGSFDQITPHIWYAPDTTNTYLIKSIDVTNLGGGPTNLVDLSNTGGQCPNAISLTATSNSEVTRAYGATNLGRFVYFGPGIDAGRATFIWDATHGCMWIDWVTGDINAAAGWGMSTTTCSACVPSGYRTASPGHIHRSYIDADGATVWTENQSFATGAIIFTIPAAGAWPAGSAMFTECDISTGSPNPLCGNHKAFYPGGFMVNGAGNTLAGSNMRIADRIRKTSNADGQSTCGVQCLPITGWSDLNDTINMGVTPLGNASHDNSAAADSNQKNYFVDCAYMNASGVAHVAFPGQQECDLVSPDPTNQHRWRLFATHLKAQLGSLTAGFTGGSSGTTCDSGGNCSVVTVGPHGFTAAATINSYNCVPSSLNAANTTGAITVATAADTTHFTYAGGPVSTTGDCMYTNPAANMLDFYATALPNMSPDGRLVSLPENSERSTVGDPFRTGNCAGSKCSQLNVVVLDAAFQTAPLSFAPSPVTFNPQQVSTTSSPIVVVMTNNTASTITLTSEALTTGTQFAISANTCGGTIAASATCNISITFTPTTAGAKNDTLVVVSSDAGSPYSIQVTGTGLATPVISPGTGSYSSTQTETITCATPGVAIYYTLDGSTPTSASTLYTGAFNVSSTTTIKAIAYLSGVASGIDTETITITGSTTTGNVVLN